MTRHSSFSPEQNRIITTYSRPVDHNLIQHNKIPVNSQIYIINNQTSFRPVLNTPVSQNIDNIKYYPQTQQNSNVRETNGNVPNGPKNSTNNVLNSPNNTHSRLLTENSPFPPAHTPAENHYLQDEINNSNDKSNILTSRTVDQDLIDKTGDLKSAVSDNIEMKNEHREFLDHLEKQRDLLRQQVELKQREVKTEDSEIIEIEQSISQVIKKNILSIFLLIIGIEKS